MCRLAWSVLGSESDDLDLPSATAEMLLYGRAELPGCCKPRHDARLVTTALRTHKRVRRRETQQIDYVPNIRDRKLIKLVSLLLTIARRSRLPPPYFGRRRRAGCATA